MEASSHIQAVRHPMSSARTPTFWEEYGDSSMLGSTLYGLLIPDTLMAGAPESGTTLNYFTDSYYPIFGSGQ